MNGTHKGEVITFFFFGGGGSSFLSCVYYV